MLKKLVLPLALIASAGAAHAQPQAGDFYAQFSAYGVELADQDFSVRGFGSRDLDYDFGFGVGGSLGYVIGNGFRAEGELAYRINSIDDNRNLVNGDYESYAFMVNGFYDIDVDAPVIPYVGAGIGLVNAGSAEDDNVFGYQLMTGVSYPITDKGALVFGYRYLGTQDAEFEARGLHAEASYDAHNLEVGYRFTF